MASAPYLAQLRELGRLYQRAMRQLDDRDLHAFVLYQAESFLHPSMKIPDAMDDRAISAHVEETADFLRHLVALHPKAVRTRVRGRRIRLLD